MHSIRSAALLPLMLVVVLLVGSACAQHPSYAQALRSQHPTLAHPAVVRASIVESMLPVEHMRATHFYRNAKTAEALARTSWFTDKEMPVLQREAEKIPRSEVYKIVKHAGFLDQ